MGEYAVGGEIKTAVVGPAVNGVVTGEDRGHGIGISEGTIHMNAIADHTL